VVSAAGNPELRPLLARTAALDVLGALGTRASKTVPELAKLLRDPRVPSEDEKNFFTLHVISALGNIGSAAGEALPDLAKAKGRDKTLDLAIDAAVLAILNPPGGKLPLVNPLDGLLSDLQQAPDPDKRLAAALRLSTYSKDAVKVLPRLVDVMKDPNPEVRDAARGSARTIVEAVGLTNEYVPGLTQLLQDPVARLRLHAASDLGARGKDASSSVPGLKNVLSFDPDPIVRQAAQNAIQAIQGK
jgi:HEAT repeat protein